MVRKIKILISLFIIMLVLSMDLGMLFSKSDNKVITTEEHEMFEIANLQHNLLCIANAIKGVITTEEETAEEDKKEDSNLVEKYGSALASSTTKAVEDAIETKDKNRKN